MGKTTSKYNMYEAKTRLSEIVEKAREGEEIILMNRGEPVAKVVPFKKKKEARKLGFAKEGYGNHFSIKSHKELFY